MKKLLPLLAFAVTACGPETLNRELRDIPGLRLSAYVGNPQFTMEQEELVELRYDRTPDSDEPCYRIPADSRLTVNGATIPLRSRGEPSVSFDGVLGCEEPWFSGAPRPMGEARVEYVLTDGRSRMRAVFQNLHVQRSLSGMNGQEQTTLRAGTTASFEWLPVTDQLEEVSLDLRTAESGVHVRTIETYRLDGNRIHFTLPPVDAGRYMLTVYGKGKVGVEACEGLSSCDARFSNTVNVNVIVE